MYPNYFEYQAEQYISLALLVAIVYFGLRFMIKLVHGDYKKKATHKPETDTDYVWRRVKVTYIAVSAFVVLMITGSAYSSTETYRSYAYRPSMFRGYLALFIGTIIAWLVYRILLPKAYKYLKKPENNQ